MCKMTTKMQSGGRHLGPGRETATRMTAHVETVQQPRILTNAIAMKDTRTPVSNLIPIDLRSFQSLKKGK